MRVHHVFRDNLNFLTTHLGLRITLKDRCGWTSYLDRELALILVPFLLHSHPYCHHIKSRPGMEIRCSRMGDFISRKCQTLRQPFWGVCHAGVGEYIFPLFRQDGFFLGYLCAGSFRGWRSLPDGPRFQRLSRHDPSRVFQTLPENTLTTDWVRGALALVADYLIRATRDVPIAQAPVQKSSPGEDAVLNRILDYMHRHFQEDLTLRDICRITGCSDSYVSHLFRRRTGATFRGYLNWLRCDASRVLLRTSADTVTKIAGAVGYNDPDYFGRVFSELFGVSPKAYRKSGAEACSDVSPRKPIKKQP